MEEKQVQFRKVFGYKYFKNTHDFEMWQFAEHREMLSITPMIGSFEMNHDIQTTNSDLDTGVMVVYVTGLCPSENIAK